MLTVAPTFDGKRTIPSQRITALMSECLQLTAKDKLLEIGTGSGFQTAEWAKSGCEVHSIELEPWVDPTAVKGDAIYLHAGNGMKGLPDEAPFTAIVATCGVSEIPDAWERQLAEGGILLVPVGDATNQRLIAYRKQNGELRPERVICICKFQMLRDRSTPKEMKPRYALDSQTN